MKYAIIGVEGPHDQAFVEKILLLLGFKPFNGCKDDLDQFWKEFIPHYPKNGNLYKRLDMPSIVSKDSLSIAIYVGEGTKLVTNLDDILYNNDKYTHVAAFGVVADRDQKKLEEVLESYSKVLLEHFPNFPKKAGVVDTNSPRTGIYILPDNNSEGVLDTLLCACGEVAYPKYMERANFYLQQLSEEERQSLKWKNFDFQKALVSTVASILVPGMTNTTSIKRNKWISQETQQQVTALANFIVFLKQLLELS